MNRYLLAGVALAAVVAAGYYSSPASAPAPPITPAPQPCPGPGPCPLPPNPPRPKPWGPRPATARVAGNWRDSGVVRPLLAPWEASVGGPVGPAGVEINCDYPGERHVKNTSSHGLGLCVFTSIHHSADWQNIEQLRDMPKWMIKSSIPGGGYPEKVKTLISRLSKERNMPEPDYVQVQGPASQVFPVLEKASKSGRMICITYSRSPTGRYGGGSISHMVNLPHIDAQSAAVLDNNYIGYNAFEWMTPAELSKAAGGNSIWAIVFANPPPPPAPHNGRKPAPSPSPQPAPTKPAKACDCSPECTCGCNDGKPCRCGMPDPPAHANYGVEWDKMGQNTHYYHKSYEVTLEDFEAAIPDDAGKCRVVAVGPKEKLAQIEADWKAYPADVKDAYVLQTFAPDHWQVRDFGFVLDKAPAIHVMKPDGELLELQDGYDQTRLVGALRRKSPTPIVPPSPLPGVPSNLPLVPAAVVGGIGLAAYVLLRKKS